MLTSDYTAGMLVANENYCTHKMQFIVANLYSLQGQETS